MRRMLMFVFVLGFVIGIAQGRAAQITLFDWTFNLDGTLITPSQTVPGAIDTSQFDFGTGLGTLTVTVSGVGAHFVGVFLDHEIDETLNTFFNEFGATQGSPASGQSWEIDEPVLVGDIAQHIATGILDNSNGVPVTAPDDVAMALGWDLLLAGGQPARLQFTVSEQRPSSGFALTQTDPDSQVTLYFTSTLVGQPIPEPGTWLLLGSGFLGLLAGRPVWRFLTTSF